MVQHIRRRLSQGGGGGVIAKGHDLSVGNLSREEVPPLEWVRLRLGLGVDGIAAKAVHGHDAEAAPMRWRLGSK